MAVRSDKRWRWPAASGATAYRHAGHTLESTQRAEGADGSDDRIVAKRRKDDGDPSEGDNDKVELRAWGGKRTYDEVVEWPTAHEVTRWAAAQRTERRTGAERAVSSGYDNTGRGKRSQDPSLRAAADASL